MSDASAFLHAGEQPLALASSANGAARAAYKREGHGMVTQHSTRDKDSREFWMIYIVTWPVFFAATLVLRLMRLASPRSEKIISRNVFRETHELASSSIPYAFMG
ncbi:MAG: hypothetical protein K2P80_03765 [Beijerinckiaceae bacterium]|nr:hypothetical protein [Beijerinckiaceae bacterium]